MHYEYMSTINYIFIIINVMTPPIYVYVYYYTKYITKRTNFCFFGSEGYCFWRNIKIGQISWGKLTYNSHTAVWLLFFRIQ